MSAGTCVRGAAAAAARQDLLNQPDGIGCTAYAGAACWGDLPTLRLLGQKQWAADPTRTNINGAAPLHFEVAGKQPEALDLVLVCLRCIGRTDAIAATTNSGSDAMHFTAAVGSLRCAERLFAAGLRTDARHNGGDKTPVEEEQEHDTEQFLQV